MQSWRHGELVGLGDFITGALNDTFLPLLIIRFYMMCELIKGKLPWNRHDVSLHFLLLGAIIQFFFTGRKGHLPNEIPGQETYSIADKSACGQHRWNQHKDAIADILFNWDRWEDEIKCATASQAQGQRTNTAQIVAWRMPPSIWPNPGSDHSTEILRHSPIWAIGQSPGGCYKVY